MKQTFLLLIVVLIVTIAGCDNNNDDLASAKFSVKQTTNTIKSVQVQNATYTFSKALVGIS